MVGGVEVAVLIPGGTRSLALNTAAGGRFATGNIYFALFFSFVKHRRQSNDDGSLGLNGLGAIREGIWLQLPQRHDMVRASLFYGPGDIEDFVREIKLARNVK